MYTYTGGALVWVAHRLTNSSQVVTRRIGHVDVWHMITGFSLFFSVLLYVDDDAGELQTLVGMYRGYCLLYTSDAADE